MAYIADYTTTAAVKARLGETAATYDTVLAAAITAASRAVDGFTHRRFGIDSSLTARKFNAASAYHVLVDDVGDSTGATVDLDLDGDGTYETALASSAWQLGPYNASLEGRPYTRIELRPTATLLSGYPAGVKVTAKWGWPSVPTEVVEATILQSIRYFTRRVAPFGIAGAADGLGDMRLLARLDPDVEHLIRHLRRLRRPVA